MKIFYSLFSILFVDNGLHPVDRLAVQRLLNMGPRARPHGAVPMLLVRSKPDQIAGT